MPSAEMSPDQVAHGLGLLLPEARPVSDLHYIPRGWGNENWLAETQLGRLLVKVGRTNAPVEKWRAATRGLQLARSAGVPAPEQLAVAERCGQLGGRILRVFRYLEGIPAAEVVTIDDRRRDRFFGELGQAVAALHGVKLQAFGSRVGQAPSFRRWSEYVSYRWAQIVERTEASGMDREMVSQAGAELTALAAEVDPVVGPVLVHRDLYLDNLLADPDGGLVGIVDFDMAEAWDPLVDFVKLDWWVFERHPGAEQAFLSSYFHDRPPFDAAWARRRVVDLLEHVNTVANRILEGAPAEALGAWQDRLEQLLSSEQDDSSGV